jgi:hypothetical protein
MKMQKFGGFIENFFSLRTTVSQKSSYLHESSLTYCRFKLVQIMVPEGQGGGQEGKLFLHVLHNIGKIFLK